MKTGQVIIGANYGDEGKGLLTDYFASADPDNSIVVRFNGGAQAGHTVFAPDGRRHVFSHFGSGSFAGCPTHLSKFFIVNPIMFAKESDELRRLGLSPSVVIDSQALVTTPFDMFINQTVEQHRGAARHGSCGLGINETVTRSLRSTAFCLRAKDLLQPDQLLERLLKLNRIWLPDRLKEYKLDPQSDQVRNFVEKLEEILRQYVHDVENLLELATITNEYPRHKRVIFEGAQGLMLDEDRIDQFPHVTRSKTGLTNVLYLAPRFALDRLNVTYVTRTYLTRHGAGRLDGESAWSFDDRTNIPNQFQGCLRFAPLNLQTLQQSISLDLSRAEWSNPSITADIAITCLDQVAMPSPKDLFLPVSYLSDGPIRSNIKPAFASTVR